MMEMVESSLERFVGWLNQHGELSYDPYDVWGTPYGLFARTVFYHSRWIGAPFVAPLVAMEWAAPAARRWLVAPTRFPSVDAHLALGYLQWHTVNGNPELLDRARRLGRCLLDASGDGYAGRCWGYPFDWQNCRGFWPKATPYITVVPDCYEALMRLADVTHEHVYEDAAASALQFALRNLHQTVTFDGAAATSYSPLDRSRVVNASALRAWMLMDGWRRFREREYREAAWRNLRFVLETQRADGAWPYAADRGSDAFIDNFHTCFVLNCLGRISLFVDDPQLDEAIERGYAFYRQALLDRSGQPRPFATGRTHIVRRELYDYAEGIRLGPALSHKIPEALDVSARLAYVAIADYQRPQGYFVTRVYRGGRRHDFPYLRWPQAQMFSALAALAVACEVEPCAASPA
ncbi:MAG: hypothetical protein HY737_04885 [Candidatus Omnitrophica bacterium]|nr:hypothetical protein [Candidatus Omnitrophota bacterium]